MKPLPAALMSEHRDHRLDGNNRRAAGGRQSLLISLRATCDGHGDCSLLRAFEISAREYSFLFRNMKTYVAVHKELATRHHGAEPWTCDHSPVVVTSREHRRHLHAHCRVRTHHWIIAGFELARSEKQISQSQLLNYSGSLLLPVNCILFFRDNGGRFTVKMIVPFPTMVLWLQTRVNKGSFSSLARDHSSLQSSGCR